MRLTTSQFAALKRLGQEKDQHIRAWGGGFGIKRSSVRVLHRLGLAILDEQGKGGVCCRITENGRAFLEQQEGGG